MQALPRTRQATLAALQRAWPVTCAYNACLAAPRTQCAAPASTFHAASYMALSATIYKVDVNVADNDRAYYGSHSLTLARHPSETDERLMVRLLAYALNADTDENLRFTRGLSEADEPELWRLDLTGAVQAWIEVGTPDERRILKACGRADEVIIYAYGRNAPLWWSGVRNKLRKAEGKLRVYLLPADATASLATLARRGMTLNINIQDGAAWVSAEAGEATVEITPA
ncbi:uncharacterized protein YaeQ [Kerstersia gyiorum]|uniref:Uncharacterized protein YaeQ n=2 Tax=Kerstersia gyiorum TaxID=206506 RepID=A0A4Q7N1G9_9BURK|nr:uncharacterized protein YaeQ [Kerstersia gyiorum]